jgi:hypothetical protein
MGLKAKYPASEFNRDDHGYFYYQHETIPNKRFPTRRAILSQLSLHARSLAEVEKVYVTDTKTDKP